MKRVNLQFVKHLMISVISVAIEILSFYLILNYIVDDYFLSVGLAFLLYSAVSYVLNIKLIYKEIGNGLGRFFKYLLIYTILSFIFILSESILLSEYMSFEVFLMIVTICIHLICSYFINKKIIFC